MKWGQLGITFGMGKTSLITRGFPRLYRPDQLTLGNLQRIGVVPLFPMLNNKNNLFKISKLFRREGVD
jgi:hypothetical protein